MDYLEILEIERTEGHFPIHPLTHKDPSGPTYNFSGLSKREYFAAMAMQGLMSDPSTGRIALSDIAINSVRMADALIKALNEPKP